MKHRTALTLTNCDQHTDCPSLYPSLIQAEENRNAEGALSPLEGSESSSFGNNLQQTFLFLSQTSQKGFSYSADLTRSVGFHILGIGPQKDSLHYF